MEINAREVPVWMREVAAEVHLLAQSPTGLKRFHGMMNLYMDETERMHAAINAWQESHDKHFQGLATLPEDNPLRTEADTPPKAGLIWDCEHVGRDRAAPPVCGWVPEAISCEGRPAEKYLLPLGDRALRLDEKYTLLAAIHDYDPKGLIQINPWAGAWNKATATDGKDADGRRDCEPRWKSQEALRDFAFMAFLRGTRGELPGDLADAEHAVRAMLEEVKADILAATPATTAPAKQADNGLPAETTAHDDKAARELKIEAAISGLVMTRQPVSLRKVQEGTRIPRSTISESDAWKAYRKKCGVRPKTFTNWQDGIETTETNEEATEPDEE